MHKEAQNTLPGAVVVPVVPVVVATEVVGSSVTTVVSSSVAVVDFKRK